MADWLKQSTAATVKLGPFLDEDDGKTTEEALTISQADIRVSKNGGAFAQTNNAAGATHDENGWYGVPLDTTDTGTLGRLTVAIHESGALPVWKDFMVVPANEYDSLISGSDSLQVDVIEFVGTTVPAPNTAGIPDVNAVEWLDTAVTISSTTSLPEVDAKSISDDATAANNLELMYDGTGYAGGTAKLQVEVVAATAAGVADFFTVDSGETSASAVEGSVVKEIVDLIVATGEVSNTGTAQAGANGTITLAAGASATNDLYIDQTVWIFSGTGVGQSRLITDYDGGTKVATVVPNWATNPDNTSVYYVKPYGTSAINSISRDATAADTLELFVEILDQGTGQLDSGSFAAAALTTTAFNTNVYTAIADYVWDETAADHTAGGSMGEIMDTWSFWSTTNAQEMRDGLGLTGTTSASSGGVIHDIKTETDKIATILTQVNKIGTGSATVAAPVATDQTVTIVRGDDYNNTDSRALDWTGASADVWPDLTAATITFTATKKTSAAGDATLSKSGSVVTPTGTQKVRLELTTAETDGLATGDGAYDYDVEATLSSGRYVTLITGLLNVDPDYTTH